MGHRASYVLIEHGATHIYYAHWGARSVPAQLLAGPDRTAAYLRTLRTHPNLLDTARAEGALLLDADKRRVLFWGGEDIAMFPYLRRVLLPALRDLWPGWTIDWTTFGVADIARHLGIALSHVLSGSFAEDFSYPIDGDGLRETNPEYIDTLITIKDADGRVDDYLFDYKFAPSAGPDLLALCRAKTPDWLPSEQDGIVAGAYLDVAARTMWIWQDEVLDPRYLEDLARRWDGWHVRGHVEGVVRQAELSGRTAANIAISNAAAVQQLVAELTDDLNDWFDPGRLLPLLTSNPPSGTEHIDVEPGFLTVDTPTQPPEERRQILQQLFHAALSAEEQARPTS